MPHSLNPLMLTLCILKLKEGEIFKPSSFKDIYKINEISIYVYPIGH